MQNIKRIAIKELSAFFTSPAAFIFLGVFLIVNLFIFFWVEKFFARNIADIRPLFEWMPILLIFLVSALSMKMWSEERRMGTLEILMTLPQPNAQFVVGKFIACMALVTIALTLTLPIPITVTFFGQLDWGPVFGAYLATLFLAGAYVSIGLFISSRTDNQIISLIISVVICSIFYLLGSDALTSLFGNKGGELLKLMGSGSRFISITRGVIDLRDLYYYLSIIGVFLTLNILTLEKIRWSTNTNKANHKTWKIASVLMVANLLMGNLWLHQIGWMRADMTQGNIYSISSATRNYMAQLQEPLIIRGYFSAKTHPLLAPLVPQLRDLIREYEIASQGKVRVEFIDPLEEPELEKEAGQKYGIKPVAFQIASKYQSSVVNSYFDVLIKYGDQYEVLSFRDLIEIKSQTETDLDIELRNPEYDITRSIKKVLYGYQGSGDLFLSIKKPVQFKGYISENNKLPPQLVKLKEGLEELLLELKTTSGGKVNYTIQAPEAGDGALAKQLAKDFGFRPMTAGLFDPNQFYFYMTMQHDGQTVQIPLPEDFSKEGIKTGIDAALKRFSAGFLKTVAMYKAESPKNRYGMPTRGGKQFTLLEEKMVENVTIKDTSLKEGRVSNDADFLIVAAPNNLNEKQVFAIDQFLMQGGTVMISTSPYNIDLSKGSLSANEQKTGLEPWLKNFGVELEKKMVLDPQNTKFPIPVKRNLGGFMVKEIQLVEYPYFVDVRSKGMNKELSLVGGLQQLTVNWASPIKITETEKLKLKFTKLIESSENSWLSNSTNIVPDFRSYGDLGFKVSGEMKKQLLGVIIEGQFQSFFKGKKSPLLVNNKKKEEDKLKKEEKTKEEPVFTGVIDKSPESARIILFSSNDFLTDHVIEIAASASGSHYLNSLQMVENSIDWSLEDRGLLTIRSRGHFSRVLDPLDQQAQMFWEYFNYALALLGLLVVYMINKKRQEKSQQ
ncbi:MAG: ABC transporter permease subunit, partial [Methylococcales bacterium]|nr:ABC transporter permease subunit [Methylococcales bacterium]